MSIKSKIIISLIVIAAIGGGLILKGESSPANKQEVSYDKDVVRIGNIVETISASGIVEPKNRLEVKPAVAGRIEEILVTEGDVVKKGQIIGWLSSSDRVALIDSARAKGEEELKRWKEIYKAIPVVSAIDGTIIIKNVEAGQTLTVSDTILTISDQLKVTSQVDETDISKIKIGQKVDITLDAYSNSSFEGIVEHIAYEATTSENVVVYEVSIKVLNAPSYMKSGMSVDSIFHINEIEDAMILNSTSVQFDNDGSYVLMMGKMKNLMKKYIKTGLQVGPSIEILEGLSVGDEVLVENLSFDKSEKSQSENPFLPKMPKRNNKK